jgi:hypothetical protein
MKKIVTRNAKENQMKFVEAFGEIVFGAMVCNLS